MLDLHRRRGPEAEVAVGPAEILAGDRGAVAGPQLEIGPEARQLLGQRVAKVVGEEDPMRWRRDLRGVLSAGALGFATLT